jgi:hypothetical protein
VEYRENITQTLPPNPRYQWEKNDRLERTETTFKGALAIRETVTMTMDYAEWSGDKLITTKNGWIIVSDRFYDASTKKILGGTWAETIKGEAQPQKNLPAIEQYGREDRPRYEMGIAPFSELNITFTDEGTESVSVPAGTWPDGRNYSGRFRDGAPITLLVVPGIPVPVQYRIHNRYLDGEDPVQSYELVGWG